MCASTALGAVSCRPQAQAGDDVGIPGARPVKTWVLRSSSAASKVVKSGTLQANKDVVLTAQVPGRVTHVGAVLGGPCQKGQTLVSLEKDTFRIALSEAKAVLRGAEAVSEQAQNTFRRLQSLEKSSGATAQQIDEAESATASAHAALERARAGFAAAKHNLDETEISCPFAGFVADVLVEQGQVLGPSVPVARVVELSSLEVRVAVTSAQLADLAVGDLVEVSDPLRPEITEPGVIARTGVAADRLTRLFPVEIVIQNPSGDLKAGQVVDVGLELGRYERGVLIPVDAVLGEGPRAHAFVVESGRAAKRHLVLGPRIGGDYIVESGAEEGEDVVLVGAHGLQGGEKVDVVARIDADGSTAAVAKKSSGSPEPLE